MFKIIYSFARHIGLYTFLKYIEFGATALLTILLAARVSPEEYGSAAFFFISVTYIQFASLGANQVLLKWYTNRKNNEDGLIPINLMFWSTLLISIIIIFISTFSGYLLFLYAASVGALKLLYEAFVNIFRVTENLKRINLLSFSFSFLFLFLTFFFAFSVKLYFLCWLSSLTVSIILGFFLLPAKTVRIRLFFSNIRRLPSFLNDGIILLLINFLGIALTTVDRSILNLAQVPKAHLGSVQLVDTITNGITLSVSSLLFVLLPRFYTLVRNADIKLNDLYRRSMAAIFLFIITMLCIYFFLNPWIKPFTFKYANFSLHFALQLITKAILLITTIPYAYMVVSSKEVIYFRIFALWVFLLILVYFLISYYLTDRNMLSLYFNSTMLLISLFLNINFYYVMRKIYR